MTENTRPASEMTDDEFAAEFRAWLDANLVGEFAEIKGAGGPGSEHEFFPQRLAWDRHMAAAGWACTQVAPRSGLRQRPVSVAASRVSASRAEVAMSIRREGAGPTVAHVRPASRLAWSIPAWAP